jgi:hypothetical protein
MDYKNGKIYKMISPSGLIYIGSTCQTLSKRKTTHKADYKKWKAGKRDTATTSFKLLDEAIDDVDIVLLEDFPCERKEQLHARERHWIDNTDCVNKIKPGRTLKEYREDKKEEIKEYYQNNKNRILTHQKDYYHNNKHVKAEYHQKNKDKIKAYKSQPIACGCGSTVTKGVYPTHMRSNKHTLWMESQSKPADE